MFRFKFSLSSFRLCRRKTTSSASIHFFSPINPKAFEIAYPVIPSPPPTTPNHRPHLSKPLTTTPEMNTSPVSRRNTTKKKGKKERINKMGYESESRRDVEYYSWLGEKKKVYVKNGGVAVEKWSEEPYQDFKRSMLEMILEKGMLEVNDLEQLLECYLSLNSGYHHADIVAAFTEVWELLFD